VRLRVGGLWRLRPRPEVVLCDDRCHRDRHCALTGRRKAALEEWTARCTCPGADAPRRSFERSAAKRRELAVVFADVDLSDRPDGETIERRLRASFQAHGEQPPPHLAGLSGVIAAGQGRRGLRSARLIGLGARALVRGVRWAWQPGPDAENRHALRRMYVSFGTLVGIAILLTTGAVRAPGWRRLPWAAAAVVTWLFTLRGAAIGTLVATIAHTAKSRAPSER
jgi:hypothetical protein